MPDGPPPQSNTDSPSMVVHPHQSKKKRFDDEQVSADLGLKPVQLQRRRVWRACESCRYVPISLTTFTAFSPDHILDLYAVARRLNVMVSSRPVLNARSRSHSVLGCRRRTEQRLADSKQTPPCVVLILLTNLMSAMCKNSRPGFSNLKDCSSKSLPYWSRSALVVSTPPAYPRPHQGVQAPPRHFYSLSFHKSGRLRNPPAFPMAPPAPTTVPPSRSRTTCRSPSASWRSMSTATCTGSAVRPLCPLFSHSSRPPHRHCGVYRPWRRILWPRARV